MSDGMCEVKNVVEENVIVDANVNMMLETGAHPFENDNLIALHNNDGESEVDENKDVSVKIEFGDEGETAHIYDFKVKDEVEDMDDAASTAKAEKDTLNRNRSEMSDDRYELDEIWLGDTDDDGNDDMSEIKNEVEDLGYFGREANSVSKKNKLYKCTDCHLHFMKRTSLIHHMKRNCFEPNGIVVKACSSCKLDFHLPTLRTHILQHHVVQKLTLNDFEIVVRKEECVSNRLYKCAECSLHFLNEESLYSHVRRSCQSNSSIVRSCPSCKLNFNPIILYKHLLLQHKKQKLSLSDFQIFVVSKNDKNNKARSTSRVFNKTKTTQVQHGLVVTTEPEQQITEVMNDVGNVEEQSSCNKSDKQSPRALACSTGAQPEYKNQTVNESQSKHIKTKLFRCDECEAHFITRGTLESHVRHNRHYTKLFLCTTCNFPFTSKTIKKHIDMHHKQLELHRNDFEVIAGYLKTPQEYRAETQLGFNKVQPKHLKTQLFKCEDCDAHFALRRTLENHVVYKRHNTKLFLCETCNFKFTEKTFAKHTEMHHDQLGLQRNDFEVIAGYLKPPRAQPKLNKSQPKHNKTQLFKCEICDAHFVSRRTLENHLRHKGHNIKLFMCGTCKLDFTAYSFSKHIEIRQNQVRCPNNFEVVAGLHSPARYNEEASAKPLFDETKTITEVQEGLVVIPNTKQRVTEVTTDVGRVEQSSSNKSKKTVQDSCVLHSIVHNSNGNKRLAVKTELNDEDVTLSYPDDDLENERCYDDIYEVKDEIEEENDDNKDDIDILDKNDIEMNDVKDEEEVDLPDLKMENPEIGIFKVEVSDTIVSMR